MLYHRLLTGTPDLPFESDEMRFVAYDQNRRTNKNEPSRNGARFFLASQPSFPELKLKI
jgi:hypothetical protein